MSAEQFFDELRRLHLDPSDPLILQAIRTVDEIIERTMSANEDLSTAWGALTQEKKDEYRLECVHALVTNIPTYMRH